MSVASPVIASFDGTNRRIYLLQGVDTFHWIDDIYIEYRQERRLNEELRKFEPFMVASGNESKGQGKATPRLLKLLLGVKVIPYNESGEIYVTGEAITDDADVDATLFDISALTVPVIINYAPPAAEVIVVDAVAKGLDYGGIVHFDENSIYTGQEHPIGTSIRAVNNIADLLAIATTYGLREINTFSDMHLTQDISGFNIIGDIPGKTFYPEGFKAHECRLSWLRLYGDFNDSLITVRDCNVIQALNVYGAIQTSFHSGRIKISAGWNLNMADCESGIPGQDSPEIDMNEGNDTTLSLRNFSGGQTITNCDTPNCVATLSFGDGGKPHFEPSCTAGYLSLRGLGFEDDRSAGTIIDMTAWFNSTTSETLIQSIKSILEGDVIPEATRFRILDKLSKVVLVDKTATEVNGLTQLTDVENPPTLELIDMTEAYEIAKAD